MVESYKKEKQKEIKLFSVDELRSEGYLNASKWFGNVELIWNRMKTEKSINMTSNDRIDFQKGFSGQNLNKKYLVLYNSSAKDANALVFDRKSKDWDRNMNMEFIVESVSYVYYTDDIREANYLCAILNSTTPNLMMKDFQARGLFGARHVHKKILDIYFPLYDDYDKIHKNLSLLSVLSHIKVDKFLEANPPKQELSAIFLGKLRRDIKNHLKEEMYEIDKLVKKILI